MTLAIRRIVTGHDAKGRAIAQIDDMSPNYVSPREGLEGVQIWTTEGFPVDNAGNDDAGAVPIVPTIANGSIFRVISFAPGVMPRSHRTETIDYVVIMSGEIDMELEEGEFTKVKAGDLVVQRGTVHNWINRGTEPCVMALVVIGAQPVTINGQALGNAG